MPENDRYAAEKHGTLTPVVVTLVVAIGAGLAAFAYQQSDTPLDPALTGSITRQPNADRIVPTAPTNAAPTS